MEGMLKQAEELSDTVTAPASPIGQLAGAAGEGLKNVYDSVKTHGGEAANQIGNAVQEATKSIGGEAQNTLEKVKEQAAPAVETIKKNIGTAAEKGKSAFKTLTSPLTPEDNRHQIIPGLANNYLGAGGGALLSMLLGNQLGLTGPAAWLLPILGGAAGYHYLPKLMNMWKDKPGQGVHSIPDSVKTFNQENPIVPPQPAPVPQAPTAQPTTAPQPA